MKSIDLKEKIQLESIKDNLGAPSSVLAGKDIIMPALRKGPVPEGVGLNFEDMGELVKIIGKVKAAEIGNGIVTLENAEFAKMAECVKSFRYRQTDVALYEYIEKLVNLPDNDIAKIAKKK